MISRLLAAFALALVVTGCGGDTPVAFGSAGKPLLDRVRSYVDQKNPAEIDRVVQLANGNMEKGNMSTNERDALVKIAEYIKANNWEAAKKLVDGCLSETAKTIGPGK